MIRDPARPVPTMRAIASDQAPTHRLETDPSIQDEPLGMIPWSHTLILIQ